MDYDLGIDVRGDVLSVLVLALAGVRRRVGWSMGGGAFLLTDVAEWIPGRHEVRSRLALLERLGIAPDPSARVDVHVDRRGSDHRRPAARRGLAAPQRGSRRAEVHARIARRAVRPTRGHAASRLPADRGRSPDEADWLHADRFRRLPPLLAVHLGAGNAAKRWPTRSWKVLVGAIPRRRLAGRRGRRGRTTCRSRASWPAHDRLRDWTGSLTVTQTTALLERADLFIGADSGPGAPGGLGRDALGHPLQRDQPAPAMAALVATFADPPPPRPLPALPPEGLPARRPPLHVGPRPRPRLPRRNAMVVADPPGGVAARADVR